MDLAPIVLFVYNRPWHTEQTLNALAENELAKDSTLYIYADGPKELASDSDLKKIEETRKVIHKKKWCKEVRIIVSKKNKGLANSVIDGVTDVINTHGKIIVLEDDIVTAKGFIRFLNEALNMYNNEKKVAGISGWSFPINVKEETYFSRVGSCWGWGTWREVWDNIDFNASKLIEILKQNNRINEFNIEGRYNYFGMLTRQAANNIDSWAVRFYANYFLSNSLFLFPRKSLVQNIGFDGTGTNYIDKNSSTSIFFEKHYVNLKYLNAIEKRSIRKKIRQSFQIQKQSGPFLKNLISRIKRKLL